jgi:hypothetical protein
MLRLRAHAGGAAGAALREEQLLEERHDQLGHAVRIVEVRVVAAAGQHGEGRRLAKKVEAARGQMLEFGRMVVGDRDLDPILDLLRHMLSVTPYGELMERRRALGGDEPDAPG